MRGEGRGARGEVGEVGEGRRGRGLGEARAAEAGAGGRVRVQGWCCENIEKGAGCDGGRLPKSIWAIIVTHHSSTRASCRRAPDQRDLGRGMRNQHRGQTPRTSSGKITRLRVQNKYSDGLKMPAKPIPHMSAKRGHCQ